MAEHFKEISSCSLCLTYLEKPVHLKCGYLCCLRCVDSLQKEPHGEGLLCPLCPVVSQKSDIRAIPQMGDLVSKVKELEPQLQCVLQMNPRMRKFQVDMTFDVDTANNHLLVSDDLRNVCCGHSEQHREEHAERFNHALCVLGSPRFTSGRHYWEVDVGTTKEWDVGVCKESVNREGDILLSSELGFWTVGLIDDQLYTASTTPFTGLWVRPRVRRMGIFLDMDVGTVSFYNLSDGSHIFTFTKIPTAEPLRPFFSPADETDDDPGFLSICPVINPGISVRATEKEHTRGKGLQPFPAPRLRQRRAPSTVSGALCWTDSQSTGERCSASPIPAQHHSHPHGGAEMTTWPEQKLTYTRMRTPLPPSRAGPELPHQHLRMQGFKRGLQAQAAVGFTKRTTQQTGPDPREHWKEIPHKREAHFAYNRCGWVPITEAPGLQDLEEFNVHLHLEMTAAPTPLGGKNPGNKQVDPGGALSSAQPAESDSGFSKEC
ncbi:ret finger protein-like 4A [Microcebus murinus]|uniref:ret finger protein-like 4A n=1 Tax=Microcebus murinus TaxID=30608 RepID=UPI003F6B7726